MRRSPVFPIVVLSITPVVASGQVFGPAGSELRVNTYTTGHQVQPEVAIDGASSFLVIWTSLIQRAGGPGLYGQAFSFHEPLGAAFRVNTQDVGNSVRSSAAGGSLSKFVTVWNALDGAEYSVFGQRFGSSGDVGAEFMLNTGAGSFHGYPAVAADSSGDFVAVWTNVGGDGGQSGIYARRYDSAGAPVTSPFRVNTYTTLGQTRPAVGRGSAGAFLVSWEGYGANGVGIYGQRFGTGGAPLGEEFQVNTNTGDLVSRSSAAFSASGAVVVWLRILTGGVNSNIYGQRFDSGVPAGSEFRVNTYTTGFQQAPRVAMDSDGAFVVVWQDNEDGAATKAQRFNASGSPRGGEFRVRAVIGESQDPAVAMNADGDFVVAWDTDSIDGSSRGIYVRLFCHDLAGNANGDTTISVGDILYLINYLFAGGPVPIGSGDADGSGSTTVTDILYLINYLFAGGPAPVCPIPII